MRFPALAASLLATLFIAGCASTVSPLYTKTDSVTDPAIVGTWISSDKDASSGTVRIEAAKDGSYQIRVHDDKSGDDLAYDARLIKLGSTSFADLLLTGLHLDGKDVDLPWGAVPLHQIVKYQVVADDLSVSTIDDGALEKSAKQSGFPLRFQDTTQNGARVILSPTGDLRSYFSAHPADIFGDPSHFQRQH